MVFFYTNAYYHANPAPKSRKQTRWKKKGGFYKRSKKTRQENQGQIDFFHCSRAAGRPGGIPLGDLHGAVLVEVLVHVESIP
jgi:hypothetical protein